MTSSASHRTQIALPKTMESVVNGKLQTFKKSHFLDGFFSGFRLPYQFCYTHRHYFNGFLVTSLTKAFLPRLLSLSGRPALGRVLVVPNLFNLRMMEATVFLGIFNAADIFWYPSPDLCLNTILSRSSTDNFFDLVAWFLL